MLSFGWTDSKITASSILINPVDIFLIIFKCGIQKNIYIKSLFEFAQFVGFPAESVWNFFSQDLENGTFCICILDKRVLQVVTLRNIGPLSNKFTTTAQLLHQWGPV